MHVGVRGGAHAPPQLHVGNNVRTLRVMHRVEPNRLDRLPDEGETFRAGAFEFEVLDMDRQRIDKVLIRRLQLQELAVHVSERPDAAEVPVLASLGELEVRDVSSRSASGDLAAQLTAKVFETSMAAVVAQMGSQMPAALANGITASLGNAGVVVNQVFEGATKEVGEAVKGVGDAVKGIGDGLGGVFGGKK